MLRALKWLKKNNVQYQNIEINIDFQVGKNAVRFINENNDQIQPIEAPKPAGSHMLTLDVKHYAATDVNPEIPEGTAYKRFLLKNMQGVNFLLLINTGFFRGALELQ